MIGKNWMKGLALAGAVAVALPLMSNAATHYTGKTPASIAMMATNSIKPVKKTTGKHKVKHHAATKRAVKKTVAHSKHKKLTTALKKKH
jgi:hypothetical protein